MPEIRLDLCDFAPLIQRAVDEAVARLDAEKPRDAQGVVLVDKRTAARMMATSESTIDRWRKHHQLPCLRLGDGRVWFRPESLRRWAAAREASE